MCTEDHMKRLKENNNNNNNILDNKKGNKRNMAFFYCICKDFCEQNGMYFGFDLADQIIYWKNKWGAMLGEHM